MTIKPFEIPRRGNEMAYGCMAKLHRQAAIVMPALRPAPNAHRLLPGDSRRDGRARDVCPYES